MPRLTSGLLARSSGYTPGASGSLLPGSAFRGKRTGRVNPSAGIETRLTEGVYPNRIPAFFRLALHIETISREYWFFRLISDHSDAPYWRNRSAISFDLTFCSGVQALNFAFTSAP